MNIIDEIKLIRKRIRSVAPRVHVRNARGTAYGWVDLSGSGEWGDFTPEEIEALKQLGIRASGNGFPIQPKERQNWAERLVADPQAKYEWMSTDWD